MNAFRRSPLLRSALVASALVVALPACGLLLGVGGESFAPGGSDSGRDADLGDDSPPLPSMDSSLAEGGADVGTGVDDAGNDAPDARSPDASDGAVSDDARSPDASDAAAVARTLTPPMGWDTFYAFGGSITEDLIKQYADILVSTGMRDAGYQYVIIDDGWEAQSRDANYQIIANPTKFPHGIAAVAAYVHSRGLKVGIFSSAGLTTGQHLPGGFHYEAQDAKTFASWGIDYIKDVWWDANTEDPQTQYGIMRDAIAASGRPMVLSICDGAQGSPWIWGPATGDSWATGGVSIGNNFPDILSHLDSTAEHAAAAGPGRWNDPDMLVVGEAPLTNDESRAQFTLWSILAAPLLATNDLRTMSAETLAILTNPEVIAVDADPAGQQGTLVADDGADNQVWSKRLQTPGTRAVALFNRGSAPATIAARWSDLGLAPGSATVRDLWQKTDLGSFQDSYTVTVASHASAMVLVAGSEGAAAPTPTVYAASSDVNTYVWPAREGQCVTCPTGSRGGWIGTSPAPDGGTQTGTLTFNGILADTPGLKTVVVEYLSGVPRGATFSVNGGAPLTVQFGLAGAPDDWDAIGTHVLQLPLNAGSNTITVSNPTLLAPDLSAIEVYP